MYHSLCASQSSYIYVFDGLPRFLGNGVVQSDHNLIGAFCGTTRTQPITVEATSGNNCNLLLAFIALIWFVVLIGRTLLIFCLPTRCDLGVL